FATWHEARVARHERLDEARRRWDEEHAKLKALVVMYRQKASYNSDMASRLQAAKTRLARFTDAGPPPVKPKEQDIRMRLSGGRTGKRATIREQVELDGLTYPFDLEVWYGDRAAVLRANGTRKSHFTLLLLDEPTDNLDLASAEALEEGLKTFDGTVVAVTHDRWFARGFDRYLLFGADGEVTETDGPVWDVR